MTPELHEGRMMLVRYSGGWTARQGHRRMYKWDVDHSFYFGAWKFLFFGLGLVWIDAGQVSFSAGQLDQLL
jgi:hypothetical protein